MLKRESECRSKAVALFTGLLLAACQGSEQEEAELTASYTVRDSAGVSIRESASPSWGDGDGWTVSDVPVDFGSTGSGPAHEFFRVWDATFLHDSLVAVSVDAEIRVFDLAGRHQLTLGRRGEGPGEFSGINLGLVGGADRLIANDIMARRLTVYSAELELVSTATVEAGRLTPTVALVPGGILAHRGPLAGPEPGYNRIVTELLILDDDATVLDSVGPMTVTELLMLPRGERARLEQSPFAKRGHLGSGGGRAVVGDASALGYRVLAPDGQVSSITRTDRDFPLTSERLNAERDALIGEDPRPDLLSLWNEMIDALPEPLTLPAYQALEVDADGFVWLEAFTGIAGELGPRRWDVFSDEDVWLGEVVLPAGFKALEFGRDRVVGVRKDEFDVETVQILAIEKR